MTKQNMKGDEMINKDLLGKITGDDIESILSENTSLNPTGTNVVFKSNGKTKVLSECELANLCKEYVYNNGFSIESGIYTDKNDKKFYGASVFNNFVQQFFSATTSEAQAVIKATEWVEGLKR